MKNYIYYLITFCCIFPTAFCSEINVYPGSKNLSSAMLRLITGDPSYTQYTSPPFSGYVTVGDSTYDILYGEKHEGFALKEFTGLWSSASMEDTLVIQTHRDKKISKITFSIKESGLYRILIECQQKTYDHSIAITANGQLVAIFDGATSFDNIVYIETDAILDVFYESSDLTFFPNSHIMISLQKVNNGVFDISVTENYINSLFAPPSLISASLGYSSDQSVYSINSNVINKEFSLVGFDQIRIKPVEILKNQYYTIPLPSNEIFYHWDSSKYSLRPKTILNLELAESTLENSIKNCVINTSTALFAEVNYINGDTKILTIGNFQKTLDISEYIQKKATIFFENKSDHNFSTIEFTGTTVNEIDNYLITDNVTIYDDLHHSVQIQGITELTDIAKLNIFSGATPLNYKQELNGVITVIIPSELISEDDLLSLQIIYNGYTKDFPPLAVEKRVYNSYEKKLIYVYGHGDHNLSSNLLRDLNEMESSTINEGCDVYVALDFNDTDRVAKRLLTTYGIKDLNFLVGSRLIKIVNDSDSRNFSSETIKSYDELNFDDTTTFIQIFKDIPDIESYSTVDFIFWNHGHQWKGFGGDTNDGDVSDYSNMSLKELSKSLKSLKDDYKFNINFICFDTCLLGAFEALYLVRGLSKYVISNPEIDMGNGLDYKNFLSGYTTSYHNPAQYLITEPETWKAHHIDSGLFELEYHCIYDMKYFDEFMNNLQEIFSQISSIDTTQSNELLEKRFAVTHYNIKQVELAKSSTPTEYIDLMEYLKLIETEIDSLKDLISSTDVLYSKMCFTKTMGDLKLKASGLSVYFPTTKNELDSTIADYNAIFDTSDTVINLWLDYLKKILQSTESPSVTSYDRMSLLSPESDQETFDIDQGFLRLGETASFIINGIDDVGGLIPYLKELVEEESGLFYEINIGPLHVDFTKVGDSVKFTWDGKVPVIRDLVTDQYIYLGGQPLNNNYNVWRASADHYLPDGRVEGLIFLLLLDKDAPRIGSIMKDNIDINTGEELFLSPVGSFDMDGEVGGEIVFYYEATKKDKNGIEVGNELVYYGEEYLEVTPGFLDRYKLVYLDLEPYLYTIDLQYVSSSGITRKITEIDIWKTDATANELRSEPTELGLEKISDKELKITWYSYGLNYTLQFSTEPHGNFHDVDTDFINGGLQNSAYIPLKNQESLFFRLAPPTNRN